ncbi:MULTISPECIES: hypothetical protein [Campylobacter]|uniref:Uncharacterized protein n=1 Tax=Campylobacter hominis (strain ATCC BAA-381 / DSM 21671 / CCUG 45161 / LMG 19568 / NCTC 13146 / CH001A) TaxID=360107 RepID=A7HZS4_CAMHC|nr:MULTISPECIES: hypothetical protein [Campylobacter]ABS52463.1 hypothetical protein CHAB381_0156 [Campylobacter hominis ATCC BAA-381]MCZ6169617.1 hypothetical protein [Campylobacter ureolyticus]UAK85376.1 hypothetical protein K8O82_05785 [Campylobacter hominis]SUW84315.1 Uncharacterised protein [Campylobacter hominis]
MKKENEGNVLIVGNNNIVKTDSVYNQIIHIKTKETNLYTTNKRLNTTLFKEFLKLYEIYGCDEILKKPVNILKEVEEISKN